MRRSTGKPYKTAKSYIELIGRYELVALNSLDKFAKKFISTNQGIVLGTAQSRAIAVHGDMNSPRLDWRTIRTGEPAIYIQEFLLPGENSHYYLHGDVHSLIAKVSGNAFNDKVRLVLDESGSLFWNSTVKEVPVPERCPDEDCHCPLFIGTGKKTMRVAI